MKSSKVAIQSFQSQLDELPKINYQQAQAWKTFTKELIVKYLGKDSEFLKPYNGAYSIFYSGDYFSEDRYRSQLILKKCIEYIQVNGIYKPASPNFLYRLSEGWATTLLALVIPSLFGAGFFVGEYFAKNRIDQDKINLTREVEKLRQENSILSKQASNPPAKKDAEIEREQVREKR